ncbi:MAG: tRNA (N6-threonylcarbamoyladenosine(37)-N6)-methyltransferase TrmO [Candidatus Lokiarchaeota archaeon]|nr:tRNA (N6-threonylcarbamoyladenosine(37)-N6)-methyltransferase TrmO [Candidatus Lokiarchaeota archaeon]MBD3341741.1 tRNA (N6-threonylcarbamoyladenosine(37)-N6)-methyltransferase TrmO [Candidatus Lokiarchaeota archaeon]
MINNEKFKSTVNAGTKTASIKEIGFVKNLFYEPMDPLELKKHESEIVIYEQFESGLHKIEENKYLQVLFQFHLAQKYELRDYTYCGRERGIFASRSSKRPNYIGLTKVKLLGVEGRTLRVKGLDALNGSPVLDIKPYCDRMD